MTSRPVGQEGHCFLVVSLLCVKPQSISEIFVANKTEEKYFSVLQFITKFIT